MIGSWPAARLADLERRAEKPYTTTPVSARPKIGTNRAITLRRAMCSSDEPFYLGIRRVYKDRDAKVDHDKARAIVRTTRDEKVCFSASDLDAPPDLRG